MKSFSQELKEREHEFEIGGEMFKWRELTWDDLEKLAAEEEAFIAREETKTKDSMDFVVMRILFFLDPENESKPRFKKMLARRANPVPHFQVQELHTWLWEQISGYPTTPPPVSSNGPGTNAGTSQAG